MNTNLPGGDAAREDSGQFEPFDLTVHLGPDAIPWLSATSRIGAFHGIPRGDTTSLSALPDLLDKVYDYRDDVQFAELVPEPELAGLLGDLVFKDPAVSQLFQATRGVAADRGRQVLFRILTSPHLAGLPWELLPDPAAAHNDQRPYLALAPDTHLVRQARGRTYTTRMSMLEAPLNLLIVLSSPVAESDREDWLSFDIFEVKRNLLAELAPLEQAGLLRIEVEDRPTLDNLRRRIGAQRRGYHLFHYVGHATPDGLILEDRAGYGEHLSSGKLAELLRLCPDLRLAVFAGCETARAAADPSAVDTRKAVGWRDLLSLADYCVQEACPAVIGMQAVLPFSTERVFTRFFYQALASGYTTAESLRLARGAIQADPRVGGALLDWSVPALFVGSGEPGALVPREAAAAEAPPRTRAELNLGLRQRNGRFFGRDLPLRQAVDVMTGRAPERVLVVTGAAGVGKTALVDRALEEVGSSVSHSLFVTFNRLVPEVEQGRKMFAAGRLPDLQKLCGLKEDHALEQLCRLTNELLRYSGVETRDRDAEWKEAGPWWERLIEDMVQQQFVLVIDDIGELTHLQHGLLERLLTWALTEHLEEQRRAGKKDHQLRDELLAQLSTVQEVLATPGETSLSAVRDGIVLSEKVLRGLLKLSDRLLLESAQVYGQCLEQQILALDREAKPAKGKARAGAKGKAKAEAKAEAEADPAEPGQAQNADEFEHLFPALYRLEAVRSSLGNALELLADRRSHVRIVITADAPAQDFLNLPDSLVFAMRLAPLTWAETWRWIRRNLPGLVRFGEDYLARLWGRFGVQLELWEELERLVLKQRNQAVDLIEVANKITPATGRRPSGKVEQTARRGQRALRIAVAGPRLAGPAEIAEALTRLAMEHGIGGRVAFDAGEVGTLATLIDEPSPFDSWQAASSSEVFVWLERVIARQPDIILLDYGAKFQTIEDIKKNPYLDRAILRRIHHSVLLIAAAGNDVREPGIVMVGRNPKALRVTTPAAYPEVLGVGPLDDNGKLLDYAEWIPKIAKPDLFMPANLSVTPLVLALKPKEVRLTTEGSTWGSGSAALHAVAASVLVWSLLPDLPPHDIRELLMEAAQPIPGTKAARGLTMEAAIALARRRLVERTLREGAASLQTLSAITGLEGRILTAILEPMIKEGRAVRLATGRLERFQLLLPPH